MNWHMMVVSKMPTDDDDELLFEIHCPGVTGNCNVWFGCDRPWCVSFEDEDYDGFFRHGLEHQWIDGEFMCDNGRCVSHLGDETGSQYELARELGLGTHYVDVQYEGDGYWYWTSAPTLVEQLEFAMKLAIGRANSQFKTASWKLNDGLTSPTRF